jgi:hypothetical protein
MQAFDDVIITQNLSKSYAAVEALEDLNLKVPRRSIFGFLGPNGAGKSTTIKLLLGLIKPTKGSAFIFCLDIHRDSLAIRHRVGYLAQHPHFYPYMTAREVLRLAGAFFLTDKVELERRANTMVTFALDLAVIEPATMICAALILQENPLGYVVAAPLLTIIVLLAPQILLSTVFQKSAGVPFTPAEMIGPVAGFMGLGFCAAWLLIAMLRNFTGAG